MLSRLCVVSSLLLSSVIYADDKPWPYPKTCVFYASNKENRTFICDTATRFEKKPYIYDHFMIAYPYQGRYLDRFYCIYGGWFKTTDDYYRTIYICT